MKIFEGKQKNLKESKNVFEGKKQKNIWRKAIKNVWEKAKNIWMNIERKQKY